MHQFLFEVGKNAIETYVMIKIALSDVVLCRSKNLKWSNILKNGWKSAENYPHFRTPSASRNNNITKICEQIRNDHRFTFRRPGGKQNFSLG